MVSFIIATTGRPTLQRTLDSLEMWAGDELVLVSEVMPAGIRIPPCRFQWIECPRGNDWGHSERNYAMPRAHERYLSFMDDDDLYVRGHRVAMHRAHEQNPNGLTIFRMRLNHMGGLVLWREKKIECGNVGTPMAFVPNVPGKLGTWPPRYGGDCTFIEETAAHYDSVHWAPDIICNVMGNNLPKETRA